MQLRELTSSENPRLRLVRRLRSRRHRQTEGLLVAEGPRVVGTALELGAAIEEVFVTSEFLQRFGSLAELLEASPVRVWLVSDVLMATISATENPQGVVATARVPEPTGGVAVGRSFLAIALDRVGDPGNVGTIIRAAHGAGAGLAVLGPGCCDAFNPKAVRASAGGVFAVSVRSVGDLRLAMAELQEQGAVVLAADAGAGVPYWEADLRGPAVLLVGSEAHGLSGEARSVADTTVTIPMPGGAESLNAGAAVAVLLCEAVRQRQAGRASEEA
jgi:TrmH family RNA methyltransferase